MARRRVFDREIRAETGRIGDASSVRSHRFSRRITRPSCCWMGRELLVLTEEIFPLVWELQNENDYRWLRLRSDSLRSYRGTNCGVQLSLPGLPESNRRRVHSCFLCPGERVQ